MNILICFLSIIFGLVITFFTIIIFHPLNFYKKKKTKEEQLFLQKTLLSTIFFIIILILDIIYIILNNTEKQHNLYMSQIFIFNFYIISLVMYNFYLSYELFSTYSNPVHFFNRLFKQDKYNYLPEFIIFIVGLLSLFIDFIIYNVVIKGGKSKKYNAYFTDESLIFILMTEWKSLIIIIICVFSIILCFKIKSKIKKFCFKKQEKLLNIIDKRILSNCLYLIYGIFYALPFITGVNINETYNIFGSLFFLFIIINDYLLHMSIIATQKFCQYKLQKTILGFFCSCLASPHIYTSSTSPLVSESYLNEFTGFSTFQNEVTSTLNSNNPNDKELLFMYKNGIFLEDYFLYYFDQVLNIITASIYQIYNSNHFSSKANDQRLSKNIKIGQDISSITGTFQNMSVSNTVLAFNKTINDSKNEIGDDIIRFDIKKNGETDNLELFKDVLENGLNIVNNNNYLNINVKSFFTPRCVESVYEQKLKGKSIGNSLLSHMLLPTTGKNRMPENQNNSYFSLLAENGKSEYFSKLKNTNIKTYDKNFNLDIYDSDEQEIYYIEKGNNSDLAQLIDQYLTYIHGKGNGTFIPSLLGVFKVKINDFKTLLVFVTKNSIVENIPKNFYTYWQLIRFLSEKPKKLASSKFNNSIFVKDDPIFERTFQLETIRDNPNYNKIYIKNYNDFVETIQSDILFLKQCNSHNFDLLLMYYEYENTQKHEKQGAIKIKKTSQGTEIIEENLPQDLIFDEEISDLEFDSKNLLNKKNELFNDSDLSGDNLFSNKNTVSLSDINEKFNINGYEGIFDSFNCMCFFTFENVFDIKKRFSLTINYYEKFINKILSNFTEYIKN